MLSRFLLLVALAACGHVPPADTAGVPPPWPAPDALRVERALPASPLAPAGPPVVPPLKRLEKSPP